SLGLGFSAGVMIYVSFMELLIHAGQMLGSHSGHGYFRILGFFGGILAAALIDRAIPEGVNPHECGQDGPHSINECAETHSHGVERKLARMGVFTAMAIAVHNFPEGFATFAAGLKEPTLGISIAVAIAIHNIPEGMSVAIPIYFATGSKSKAFTYSLLSGLAEPLGALIGYSLLRPFLNDFVFGIMFAAVAGIMVYISFDELLPAARRYGKGHIVIIGLTLGMLVMAISLDVLGHAH
ncbi:MAG TPA: zinc transporter ZupT, partial [Candidatus Goldiibacteriota bacterium]|nr:zinc transporter ZupT [Candidatus Goldiibacteriota bacterium]